MLFCVDVVSTCHGRRLLAGVSQLLQNVGTRFFRHTDTLECKPTQAVARFGNDDLTPYGEGA